MYDSRIKFLDIDNDVCTKQTDIIIIGQNVGNMGTAVNIVFLSESLLKTNKYRNKYLQWHNNTMTGCLCSTTSYVRKKGKKAYRQSICVKMERQEYRNYHRTITQSRDTTEHRLNSKSNIDIDK